MINTYEYRGAYCTMTMIVLLAIPLELPPNAPARARGFTSFLDGLPEYLSRCTFSCSKLWAIYLSRNQAKRSKVVYLVPHKLKLMAHMCSVYLHVCAFSDPHTKLSRSTLKPATKQRTVFADDYKVSQFTTANILALCATIRTRRRLLWADKQAC